MDEVLRIGTLQGMSQVDKIELLKAMEDAGIKPAPLAAIINRDKDYIRDYLNGRKKSLKVEDAQNIADALGVPLARLTKRTGGVSDELGLEVAGKVSAGFYRDISIEDQDTEKPRIQIARDLRFPEARQYALLVEGDSMDQLYPNGCTVVCVDYHESGVELQSGMSVHVERSVMGGQFVEATLKEVRREGRGKVMLWPRSSNPSHKPFEASGSAGSEVEVKGIVIGEWRPVSFRK